MLYRYMCVCVYVSVCKFLCFFNQELLIFFYINGKNLIKSVNFHNNNSRKNRTAINLAC